MKLLIIEGPDRCGKNTLISKFVNQAENSIVRHWGSAKGSNNSEMRNNQHDFFKKEFDLASRRNDFDMGDLVRYPNDIYIWNRAHLGEFVYGKIYRNTHPYDWVFQMERNFGFDIDASVYLVLLTADTEFLLSKEDGKSLSKGRGDTIDVELRKFRSAFNSSGITNKLELKVNNGDNYMPEDSIFNKVNNFVFNKD